MPSDCPCECETHPQKGSKALTCVCGEDRVISQGTTSFDVACHPVRIISCYVMLCQGLCHHGGSLVTRTTQ